MAFDTLGTFISQQAKASSNSDSFGVEVGTNAGELLVIVIAKDNTTTTDGNTVEVSSVGDSGGANTWQKLREFCNSQGSAAAGATVSIWYTVATAGLSTLDTIDVNYASACTAKAITGWRFSLGAGNGIVVATNGAADLANDGADAGSMTLSSLANVQHLFLRGGAVENPLTTYTASTNYTTFDHAGANTTGAGAATNMAARGEFRILTATTDTTDPTTAAQDQASIMLALNEVALPTSAPYYFNKMRGA